MSHAMQKDLRLRYQSWFDFGKDFARLAGGSVILSEGRRGDAVYVLVEGRVEVSRVGTPLATLGPGDLFGEILYFPDNKSERSTTFRSLGPALLLEIKAAALNAASAGCRVRFNKASMRLLVDRPSEANRSRLAAR